MTQPIVNIVNEWLGASLQYRRDDLCKFVARGHEGPALLAEKISNCGLFALAVWHAAGVHHPLLASPYQTGMAIAWIKIIATDLGARRTVLHDGLPTVGSLCHYYSKRPSTDDHVEFVLESPDESGKCLHGGGGRSHCEIASSTGDIRWSLGRPLQYWYDVAALLPEGSPCLPSS